MGHYSVFGNQFVKGAVLIASIGALYISTSGCDSQQAPSQKQPKAAVSEPLVEKLTDQRLLEIYQDGLTRVGHYMEEEMKALEGFALRSEISMDQIEPQDYEMVTNAVRKSRSNDPKIKPILGLGDSDKSRLVSLVNNSIDHQKTRRQRQTFYARMQVPVFRDYGLFIEGSSEDGRAIPYPVAIVEPLVCTIDSGKKTEAIKYGERFWVPRGYYETKMTPYARGVMEFDLQNLTRFSSALESFLGKIKPEFGAEQITALLNGQSGETRNAIENALGIAKPGENVITYTTVLTPTAVTYADMGKRLRNMKQGTAELRELLRKK